MTIAMLILPLLLSLLCSNTAVSADDCRLQDIVITDKSLCRDKGTMDWEDDVFYVDLEVRFQSLPENGRLRVDGPLFVKAVEVPVAEMDPASGTFAVEEVYLRAGERRAPIELRAFFSAEPDCIVTKKRAGESRRQCSLCVGPRGTTGGPYPRCWPEEDEQDPCTQSLSYAPDPDYPELTPLRYIKTVIHVFQKEDPERLGQYARHPEDPANFTEEHIDIFRSWFTDSLGANWILSQLCDDPTDGSPHMTDTRIRLLNTGTIGKDVFFHPDNRAWGTGFGSCKGSSRYWYRMRRKYVERPDTAHPDYEALRRPEMQNAFHVFITAGSWAPEPPGDPRIPDDNDCYWPCAGGMTSSMGCKGGAPPSHPTQAIFGTYNIWLHGHTPGVQTCERDYPGTDAALGGAMLGEVFHVLTLDHLSPFQAHKRNSKGIDGCLDTPPYSEYNRLGCGYGTRCALTACQIGRMHHFFAALQPAFERFPDGRGGYSMERPRCAAVEPDLRIPAGADIVWSGNRMLRSGIVVEAGARLAINCELGLPGGASVEVKPGGALVLNGARLYTPCPQGKWRGITVGGQLEIAPGSSVESAERLQLLEGGVANARQSRFINCGMGEGMNYCGQAGNTCD